MAKGKSLEQIEAQMLELKEKENALHEKRRALAAQRREIINDKAKEETEQ